MILRNLFLSLFLCISLFANAQDVEYARSVINTIAADDYYGRGYTNKGDLKAAKFIEAEFEKMGLKKFNDSYFQKYSFPINTISKIKYVKLDDKELVAGEEFIISPRSEGIKGTFPVFHLPDSIYEDPKAIKKIKKMDLCKHFIITEKRWKDLKYKKQFECLGIIYVKQKKMVWSVSGTEELRDFHVIDVRLEDYPWGVKEVSINYKTKYIKDYETQNIVAYVEGKKNPDSFFVFTAHYDHLGMMGDVIFPGANDNASGTAMVLDLARHYAQTENQPDYSIAFILVSGEESGLHGSFHYAENPLFPLKQISFLINLDMVGTGSEGMAFVNGAVFHKKLAYALLINKEKEYMPAIRLRGESCNSDHCAFYRKGVPAVFIYTMGKEHREYHNIYDRPESLPLTQWNGLFLLLTEFVQVTSI